MSSRLFTAMMVATLTCLPLAAQKPGSKAPPPRDSHQQPQRPQQRTAFMIVQVGDEVQVVSREEIATLKRDLDDKHRQAMADWNKAKAAAAAKKEKFEQAEPKMPAFQVRPGTYPDKETAEATLAKMKGEHRDGPQRPKDPGVRGKPEGDKPDGGRPAGDKPEGGKPDGGKPDGGKPAGDKPAGGKPAGHGG